MESGLCSSVAFPAGSSEHWQRQTEAAAFLPVHPSSEALHNEQLRSTPGPGQQRGRGAQMLHISKREMWLAGKKKKKKERKDRDLVQAS